MAEDGRNQNMTVVIVAIDKTTAIRIVQTNSVAIILRCRKKIKFEKIREMEPTPNISDIEQEELAALAKSKSAEWVVYILRSVPRPMRTYAGVTNNILHRIRQHNGEIVGGARATKTTRPWALYGIIYGFGSNKCRALRCEWFTKIKHFRSTLGVPGKNGVERRRFLVRYAMNKCAYGPELCARILSMPENGHTPELPQVRYGSGCQAESLTVVPEQSEQKVRPISEFDASRCTVLKVFPQSDVPDQIDRKKI